MGQNTGKKAERQAAVLYRQIFIWAAVAGGDTSALDGVVGGFPLGILD